MPVKVLYLITELNIGGAEKVLVQQLRHLDRSRFTPTVACLYDGNGAVGQEIRALGIPVIDLGMTAKWRWDAFARLYQLLRRERPSILHTSLFHANISGRLMGRLAGVPIIICSEHTIAMESEWRYRLNHWTSGLVDRVTTVSETMRQFCLTHIGLPTEKVSLIYNGVEFSTQPQSTQAQARAELGLPANGTILGAVSRFDPVKGVNYLLEALARLHQPEVQLVLIGGGVQRPELEAMAQKLGIAGRVHWAGFRSNIPGLLPALDIFVQPSVYEGLPMSVLEAMAAGLPVVATAVGGTPEIVSDGVTGCLVPPRDPAALVQAIQTLISQPELRDRMGQAGLERVRQEFSVQQMVQRTEALYEELLINAKLSPR